MQNKQIFICFLFIFDNDILSHAVYNIYKKSELISSSHNESCDCSDRTLIKKWQSDERCDGSDTSVNKKWPSDDIYMGELLLSHFYKGVLCQFKEMIFSIFKY